MTDHLKASPPDRYEEISRHLLDQAQEEMAKGDILQASDKVWSATAHTVKAACQRLGWNHHAHNHIRAAANFVASQIGRDDLKLAFGYLDAVNMNYCEHQLTASEVRVAIDQATFFIHEFSEASRTELPENFDHLSPLEREDQERLFRLLTRKNRYSHGPQLEGDELDSLPPLKPATVDAGETDAG